MLVRPDKYVVGSDEAYMAQALLVAQQGLGWTTPNPPVGCLLVKDGLVIGRGAHLSWGREHAEVNALRQAGGAARGATAYTTLEPCTHIGKQPACVAALAEAGVSRVVYGTEDADPVTAGAAQAWLSERGIEVLGGVLRAESERLLDAYLHSHRQGRAFFHLKLALSLDAKLACANGHSQWLSGPESLGYAHYLRQQRDAVMVGWRTVLADNPRLTTRPEALKHYCELDSLGRLRNPVRVIIDPRFSLLPRLHDFHISDVAGEFQVDGPRLILAGLPQYVPDQSQQQLADGIELLVVDQEHDDRMSFAALAAQLVKLNLTGVLVEGGGGVARELLRQCLVDRLSLVYTPRLLGAEGIGFSPELGLQSVADGPRLTGIKWEQLGTDILLDGVFDAGQTTDTY